MGLMGFRGRRQAGGACEVATSDGYRGEAEERLFDEILACCLLADRKRVAEPLCGLFDVVEKQLGEPLGAPDEEQRLRAPELASRVEAFIQPCERGLVAPLGDRPAADDVAHARHVEKVAYPTQGSDCRAGLPGGVRVSWCGYRAVGQRLGQVPFVVRGLGQADGLAGERPGLLVVADPPLRGRQVAEAGGDPAGSSQALKSSRLECRSSR